MHRFPQRSRLDILTFQRQSNPLTIRPRHCRIDHHTSQPMVRLAPVRNRHKRQTRQIPKSLLIQFAISRPLDDLGVQTHQLTPPHRRQQIAQPIVVSYLGVLVVRSRLTRLSKQIANPLNDLRIRGNHHAAAAGRDDLVPVKRKHGCAPEETGRLSTIRRAHGMGRVLDPHNAKFIGDFLDGKRRSVNYEPRAPRSTLTARP